MDWTTLLDSLQTSLGEAIPNLLLALAILVLGWIVAVAVRAFVRRSLGFLQLNQRVRAEAGGTMDIEGSVAKGGYYLILLITLIAFFNALRLPLVSAPLQSLVDEILVYLPNLIAGAVLIVVAWLVATVLRRLASRALASTKFDEKLTSEAGMRPMSENVGNVLYGLVLLLFLPAILGTLELQGLLRPMQGMVDKILVTLPNLLAAGLLAAAGWFVAKLLRNLVTNLLEAAGADKLGERAGLRGTLSLSRLLGLLVFIFVFVPALISALNALELDAVSGPATDMLAIFLAAIPNLFAAGIILAAAFFLSEFLANLATNLLGGLGFDQLPSKLGIGAAVPGPATPSKFVGRLIMFFVMLFAMVEASNVLGFRQVSNIVERFIEFGGQVLLGVIIIAIGLWIANLANTAIRRLGGSNATLMSELARYAILGIVFAMGLRAMNVANEIVTGAFYVTLGAVGVAFALSFGLGGREAAGRQMEHWLSRFRGDG